MSKVESPNFYLLLLIYGLFFSISLEKLYVPLLPLHFNIIYLFTISIIFLHFRKDIKNDIKSNFSLYIIYYLIYCFISVIFFYFYTPKEVFSILPKEFGIRGSPLRGLYILCQNFLLISIGYASCKSFSVLTLKAIKKIILISTTFLFLFLLYEFFVRNFLAMDVFYLRTEGFWSQSLASNGNLYRLWGTFEEPGTLAKYCGTIYFFIFSFSIFFGFEKMKKDFFLFFMLTLFSVFGLIFAASFSSVISLGISSFIVVLYIFIKDKSIKLFSFFKSFIFFIIPFFLLTVAISSNLFQQKLKNTFDYDKNKITHTAPVNLNSSTTPDLNSHGKISDIFKLKKIHGVYQFINIPALMTAPTSNMRIVGMLMTLNQIFKTPFFGIGFGNMPFYTYMPDASVFSFGSFNFILASILEIGIFGNILFLFLFFKVFTVSTTSNAKQSLLKVLKFTFVFCVINNLIFGVYTFSSLDMVIIGSIFAVKS